MTKNKQEIINDINAYIQQGGGGYGSWYVGISKDARDRLFSSHNVKEEGDWWIYRQASSSQVAREIEYYFINSLGTDGGTGGGDVTADIVYAYKKRPHTDPC
jgi:hypothetical protein